MQAGAHAHPPPPPPRALPSAGVVVTFPMHIYLPKVTTTTVTAISLLTVPAGNDPEVIAKTADIKDLWTAVYRLYGYDAGSLNVRGCCGGGAS